VRCSVLQFSCEGLLQRVAVCCNVVQCGAVWCSVVQCVAVCSVVSVLQCVALLVKVCYRYGVQGPFADM